MNQGPQYGEFPKSFYPDMHYLNWSPKSKVDCISPHNQPATWKSWFIWNQGKWINPAARPVQWLPRFSAAKNGK